jgi:hypothetical protein
MDQEEGQALADRVRAMSVAERDKLAERYVKEGAPGMVFEYMHRGGWRPLSQRQGDGIPGGDLDEGKTPARKRRKK